MRHLIAAAVLAVALPGAASALTFNGSWNVSGSALSDPDLVIRTSPASGTFTFDLTGVVLQALTSHGTNVLYTVSGGTLIAYLQGGVATNVADQVFTVSLTSGGNFTVNLLKPIDHLPNSPANNDDQDIGLDLSAAVKVTDADNDFIRLDAGSFVVRIEDDIPGQTAATVTANVDEDELTGGITDSDGETTTATGSISGLAQYGADGAGSFSFDAAALGGLPALTSNGTNVLYTVSGGVLIAYLKVPAFVATLGGLAMLRVLQASFVAAFAGRFTLGALVTFVVTVADVKVLNIGAAFWGLVAGFAVSWLLERGDFASGRAPAGS